MRNDSADDLERLDTANLHCEMHYLLLSILHTTLTADLKKIRLYVVVLLYDI
jgi:hypothetical protein